MTKKKNLISQSLLFITFMIIGGALGYFVGKFLIKGSSALPTSVLITMVVFFIPAFFIVIGFHEMGHVTAGRLMKFEFRSITVGPFMWDKQQDGIKFKWNRNINTAGGLALCLPTGTENLVKRFAFYAAGGPIASVILAMLSFSISRLLIVSTNDGNLTMLLVKWLLLEISLLSAVIGAVTLIPVHAGGFSSDGARILNLLKGGDTSKFELLILKIFSAATSGTRPSFYDMKDLNEARELALKLNAPFAVYIYSFLHQAAFDKEEWENAEIHLQSYIEHADRVPDGVRGMVWLDAAFFYAYAKKDPLQAQQYWSRFKPSAMIPKSQISATEAAIAILKNDFPTASAAIATAEITLPDMIDKGNAIALKDKLQVLKKIALGYTETENTISAMQTQ